MAKIQIETKRCMFCNQRGILTIDGTPEQVRRWKAGELIQNVFPNLSADEREQMISGTHPKCWDEAFGEEQ